MKSHPKQLGVQMAATACLYNLSKGEVGAKVHPACLTRIVNLTLLAMENFPNHQQVSDRLSHWPPVCPVNITDTCVSKTSLITIIDVLVGNISSVFVSCFIKTSDSDGTTSI